MGYPFDRSANGPGTSSEFALKDTNERLTVNMMTTIAIADNFLNKESPPKYDKRVMH